MIENKYPHISEQIKEILLEDGCPEPKESWQLQVLVDDSTVYVSYPNKYKPSNHAISMIHGLAPFNIRSSYTSVGVLRMDKYGLEW